MSTWRFNSTAESAAGSNTVAGILTGGAPLYNADVPASKKNVILTERGWVRRITYTDTHGNARTKEEVVVAATPAGFTHNQGYANTGHIGFPGITTITLSANNAAGGAYANNTVMNIFVSYNQAVRHNGTSANLSIVVANTISGLLGSAIANTTNSLSVIEANNTLVFNFTPLLAGVYKINGQVMANVVSPVAANLVNSVGRFANLVITGAVSNALGTFTVI